MKWGIWIYTVSMQRVGQNFYSALDPSQAIGLLLGGNGVSEYDGTSTCQWYPSLKKTRSFGEGIQA
jgi:hypothetical protein